MASQSIVQNINKVVLLKTAIKIGTQNKALLELINERHTASITNLL